MLISLSANHATSSATTIESVTAASTNNAAITSITNTITRIKHVAGFENLTSFLIVMIFICGMYSVGVFFTGFASFIYELHPKVQVDSTSFLSVYNISYPQTTTAFNMVFSLRNTRSLANYSLIFSTMYLHHGHKYLSDKRLPSFVLKPREKTQLKAKFWLIDDLLPSDMASGKVNFEIALMAVIVVKLTLGYNRGYLVRFVCSNLKLANSSSWWELDNAGWYQELYSCVRTMASMGLLLVLSYFFLWTHLSLFLFLFSPFFFSLLELGQWTMFLQFCVESP